MHPVTVGSDRPHDHLSTVGKPVTTVPFLCLNHNSFRPVLMLARSTPAEPGKRRHIPNAPRSNTTHNYQPASNQLRLNTMHTSFASDRRSCKHTLTKVLTIQRLTSMRKRQEFSDGKLMQAMGIGKPSSKSRTEVAQEMVAETIAPIPDEPASMEQSGGTAGAVPPARHEPGFKRWRGVHQRFAGTVRPYPFILCRGSGGSRVPPADATEEEEQGIQNLTTT